jgi:hypothetical protein
MTADMQAIAALVAWLRAQYDEDERIATAACGAVPKPSGDTWRRTRSYGSAMVRDEDNEVVVYDEGRPTEEQAEHIARWDPARVLREIEAKRLRIDYLVGLKHDMGPESFATYDSCRILAKPGEFGDIEVGYCSCGLDAIRDRLYRIEALPYAHRPGYREEWKP